MTRARKSIRRIALTAAVLLLWCHGLDTTLLAHAVSPIAHPALAGTELVPPPVPVHPELPEVSCCFGGAGSNLLSASLSRAPSLPAPMLAAVLSLLLLAALPVRVRPSPRRTAAQHASLVEQAVLIRI